MSSQNNSRPPVQTIRCQIETCVYNTPDHFCSLPSICVRACRPCSCINVNNRSDSMCENFVRRERMLLENKHEN